MNLTLTVKRRLLQTGEVPFGAYVTTTLSADVNSAGAVVFVTSIIRRTVAALNIIVNRAAFRSWTRANPVADLANGPPTGGGINNKLANAMIEGSSAEAATVDRVAVFPPISAWVSTDHLNHLDNIAMNTGRYRCRWSLRGRRSSGD